MEGLLLSGWGGERGADKGTSAHPAAQGPAWASELLPVEAQQLLQYLAVQDAAGWLPAHVAGSWELQQLRQRCEAVQQQQQQQQTGPRVSSFQRQVHAACERLVGRGLLHSAELEVAAAGGLLSVDVAVVLADGRTRVAVEADGPSHYSRNWVGGGRGQGRGRQSSSSRKPAAPEQVERGAAAAIAAGSVGGRPAAVEGATLLRNRLLGQQGWRVVSVPWFEWQGVSGSAQEELLMGKLSNLEAVRS
jgi:hypothetical protein